MNRMSCKGPILIVEDDRKTSELLVFYLRREGFDTMAAYDGTRALELAMRHRPLFAILDVMLPDLDGWELCRRLRKTSSIPILILSARGQAHDRMKGLRLGADDYVVKPFSFGELVARVKAILRRSAPRRETETLSHGALTVDLARHRVTLAGQAIPVTSSELRLLTALMAAPGRVFSREELIACLYPSGGVVIDRAIDVHIAKLRQKIENDSSRPRYIMTTRGAGYCFSESGEEQPSAQNGA